MNTEIKSALNTVLEFQQNKLSELNIVYSEQVKGGNKNKGIDTAEQIERLKLNILSLKVAISKE